MEWREVVEHPSLKDLPFKIETNEWGKIMMAPASDAHGIYQAEIAALLKGLQKEGKVSTECPVKTSKGTKVADVAWRSPGFLKKHGIKKMELPESPEVVVEIASPANTVAELEERRQLYFEVGAREFWLCDENGNMRFFTHRGELEGSELFNEFPKRIEIDLA